MALIADLLIAAALLAAVVIGARRGLLRSLTGLVVVVLAFVLASWAAEASILRNSSSVMKWEQEQVAR